MAWNERKCSSSTNSATFIAKHVNNHTPWRHIRCVINSIALQGMNIINEITSYTSTIHLIHPNMFTNIVTARRCGQVFFKFYPNMFNNMLIFTTIIDNFLYNIIIIIIQQLLWKEKRNRKYLFLAKTVLRECHISFLIQPHSMFSLWYDTSETGKREN